MKPVLFDPLKAKAVVDAMRADPSAVIETASGMQGRVQPDFETAAKVATVVHMDETGDPDLERKIREDFRYFLVLVWRYLGLPDPTPVQMDVAYFLQHGPSRAIILAFRGLAKSWITAAYVLWCLYCDAQQKIMVVSGSLKRAVAFTNFCMFLIREMPLLAFLRPQKHQRQSALSFDVGPARPDQNPSLHAVGVGGQTTGFRGDKIVGDDVETAANSLTTVMRAKIEEATKEFESILKPGGKIQFLGTPHSVDTLYRKLIKRGYTMRIWPGRYPTKEQTKRYGDYLAPYIQHHLKRNPALVGHSSEPTRFTDEDLAARELAMGSTTFALQFMLDTSLADAKRFPLRLENLIVMGLDRKSGPDLVSYGRGPELRLEGLPNMGMEGDYFYGPANVSKTFSPYSKIFAKVDPSGEGLDETALGIAAELHGMVYILCVRGWLDGHSQKTLRELAETLVEFGVHECDVEENFGGAMFAQLLRPHVIAAWAKVNKGRHKDDQGGTLVTSTRAVTMQKELRTIGVLEPATESHRVVLCRSVIEDDFKYISSLADSDGEEGRHNYSLIHQWSHITRERDCLGHDDRIEVVADAVGHFAELLGIDPGGAASDRQEERLQEELEELFADTDEVQDIRRGRVGRPKAARAGRTNLERGKLTRR